MGFWRKLFGMGDNSPKARKRRSFDGAGISRLFYNWLTTPKPIDEDLKQDLQKLQARTRALAQNNDYVRRYLQMMRQNVVGPEGFILLAKAEDRDDVLDEKANDVLEMNWREWGRYGSPEVTTKMSWVDCQNLFLDHVMRDGEAIVRIHRRLKKNRWRFSLEFIDPLYLDPNLNDPERNICMGVERDAYGAPVAYYFLESELDAQSVSYQWEGKKYRRIAAKEIMHRFLPEWALQTRGYPRIVSCMSRLKMLDGYEEAHLVAARMGASQMGFFEDADTGETFVGDDEEADGTPIIEAEPGTFHRLPHGVKVQTFSPSQPNVHYNQFLKGVLRGVASGMGVSYNALANDLENVTFSSIRTGELQDREIYKGLQRWMIEAFIRPVFEEWLDAALFHEQLKGKGIKLRNDGDKYRRVDFQGRRWDWIDPLRDMQANILAVQNGLMSRGEIIRDQGKDPDDVWREIEAEILKGEEMGIPFSIQVPANAQEPEIDFDGEEDEKRPDNEEL